MSSKTYVRITAVPLSSRMEPIKLKSTASTERQRRILYNNCFVTQSAAGESMENLIRELLCFTDMSRVESEFIANLKEPQVAVIFKLEEVRKTKRKSGLTNKRIRKTSICPYAFVYTRMQPYDHHGYIRELTDVICLRHHVRSNFSKHFDLIRMPDLDLCDTTYLFEYTSMLYPKKGFITRADNQFRVKSLTINALGDLESRLIHKPFQTLGDWFPYICYMADQDILSLFGKICMILETYKKCLIQMRICHSDSELKQFRIIYALCTNFISPICVHIGGVFICFLIQGFNEDISLRAYSISDTRWVDPVKTIQIRGRENGDAYILSISKGVFAQLC